MKYPNVQPIEKEDYEPYCKRATRQKAYPSLLKSESPKPVTRSEKKADQAEEKKDSKDATKANEEKKDAKPDATKADEKKDAKPDAKDGKL